MHKSKLLSQLYNANMSIKRKTSQAKSKLSNLENNIIALKNDLAEENHSKLEEMRHVID